LEPSPSFYFGVIDSNARENSNKVLYSI